MSIKIKTAIVMFDPEISQLDLQFEDKRIEIKKFLKDANGKFVTVLPEYQQLELMQELIKSIKN